MQGRASSHCLSKGLAERVTRNRGFSCVGDKCPPQARRLFAPDPGKPRVRDRLLHGILHHKVKGTSPVRKV
jgi:hypothetical protein